MSRSPPVPVPDGLTACRALLAYEGPARELVARLKYRNARSALDWLAAGIADLVRPQDLPAAVTWAPTSRGRRRSRGFDQAEVLARHLATQLSVACPAMLTRLPGPPQTGRSHVERRVGPRFEVRRAALRFRHPQGLRSPDRSELRTVLLVDDVITTGATLSAAGTALLEAGLGPLIGLAAAYTAPPSWSPPTP